MIGCTDTPRTLPYYNSPDFTPVFVSNDKVDDLVTHRIAAFTFTDQHGKNFSDQAIDGRIHVADFFFASCGNICPVMTNNMNKVSEAFRNDSSVVLLSFSVTPWIDTVEKLKEYANDHHITNPNWHLLTGTTGTIYTLARTSYFAEERMGFTKDSTDFLHTEHFLLVDQQKRIRGIYNGTLSLEIEQLITDIKSLQKEK